MRGLVPPLPFVQVFSATEPLLRAIDQGRRKVKQLSAQLARNFFARLAQRTLRPAVAIERTIPLVWAHPSGYCFTAPFTSYRPDGVVFHASIIPSLVNTVKPTRLMRYA
jgi:hypothetical protein